MGGSLCLRFVVSKHALCQTLSNIKMNTKNTNTVGVYTALKPVLQIRDDFIPDPGYGQISFRIPDPTIHIRKKGKFLKLLPKLF
jgi:hypothetical protein